MAARKIAARTIRFRTQGEYESVKKAARLSKQSMNEFVVSTAVKAASEVVTKSVIDNNPEAA